MLAARMHGYKQPLVLEEVKIPEIACDQVLVRVGGAGMCRSDVQLIDGYFQEAIKPKFPITPGREIAGLVEALGDRVPETAQLAVGDQLVVSAGWGDGTCRLCRAGNEQICEHGSWPGFGPPGGYAEFIAVPYRQLIRVGHRLNWEELAPLPDAGVTPYRGIKKLRAAGVIGPDRVMAVFGASGLGSYAAQYAKLLSSGSTIDAFARNEEKLAIAKERGAGGRAVIVSTSNSSPLVAKTRRTQAQCEEALVKRPLQQHSGSSTATLLRGLWPFRSREEIKLINRNQLTKLTVKSGDRAE